MRWDALVEEVQKCQLYRRFNLYIMKITPWVETSFSTYVRLGTRDWMGATKQMTPQAKESFSLYKD